jgi:hypothetical protein
MDGEMNLLILVMPARSRSKNGVASLAYVAGIPIGVAVPF